MLGPGLSAEEKERLGKDIMVVDDERMPYTDDFPVDIEMNLSGSIRRLNPEQLLEIETNFIGEQLQLQIRKMKSQDKKAAAIFKFLSIINEDEGTFFRQLYDSYDRVETVNAMKFRIMDDAAKTRFIKSVEDDGFYIVRPPHKPILYDHVCALYDAFPTIKPVPLYVNLFGIQRRRVLNDGIVGFKYILVLKQNSNKNFSARSTFRINRVNLPAKDITKKTNRSAYAKSPIRLSEIYNLMISISGRTLAEYDVFTRSSALGRKSLDRILETEENPMALKKLKVKNEYINTNADVLSCRLKSIGVRIVYRNEVPEVALYEDIVTALQFGPYTIYDSPKLRSTYATLFRLFKAHMRENTYVGEYIGESHDIAWDHIFTLDEVKEFNLSDEIKEMLKTTTKGALLTPLIIEKPKKIVEEDLLDGDDQPVKKRRGRKPKVVIETIDPVEEKTE